MKQTSGIVWASGLLFVGAALISGCGGGGGGGDTTGTNLNGTTNVQGTLVDKSTGIALGNRTVTITTASTTISAVTAADGTFTLTGVPDGNQTLSFKDSVGSNDGSVTENITQNGGTQQLGNVVVDVSSFPPPPPI